MMTFGLELLTDRPLKPKKMLPWPGGWQSLVTGLMLVHPGARGGEAGHLGPGGAAIGALPEAEGGVLIAGSAEINDVAVVGVDGEPLAIAPATHVSADFERESGNGPCVALVGALEDGSVVGIPRIGVSADSGIDGASITGIDSDREDAGVSPVIPVDPVEQRQPSIAAIGAAVEAANIGSRVHQVLHAGVIHDAGDEPASDDPNVVPGIRGLPNGAGRQERHTRDGEDQRNGPKKRQNRLTHDSHARSPLHEAGGGAW